MSVEFHAYRSQDEANQGLLQALLTAVSGRLASQNHVSIALAGGSTPKPLYQKLSKQTLPWDRVKITLTDERWVPIVDDQSNERMLRECFSDRLKDMGLIGLKGGEDTAEEGVGLCELKLKKALGTLDVVLLGMGEDGHFASIFPSEDLVEQFEKNRERLCVAVNPENQCERISLTMSFLLTAPYIFFLIGGEKKKQQFYRALEGESALPIHHLLTSAKQSIHVFWFKGQ